MKILNSQVIKISESESEETQKQPCMTTFDYKDGTFYSGETCNGKYHGSGQFKYSNGAVLQGNFENGILLSGSIEYKGKKQAVTNLKRFKHYFEDENSSDAQYKDLVNIVAEIKRESLQTQELVITLQGDIAIIKQLLLKDKATRNNNEQNDQENVNAVLSAPNSFVSVKSYFEFSEVPSKAQINLNKSQHVFIPEQLFIHEKIAILDNFQDEDKEQQDIFGSSVLEPQHHIVESKYERFQMLRLSSSQQLNVLRPLFSPEHQKHILVIQDQKVQIINESQFETRVGTIQCEEEYVSVKMMPLDILLTWNTEQCTDSVSNIQKMTYQLEKDMQIVNINTLNTQITTAQETLMMQIHEEQKYMMNILTALEQDTLVFQLQQQHCYQFVLASLNINQFINILDPSISQPTICMLGINTKQQPNINKFYTLEKYVYCILQYQMLFPYSYGRWNCFFLFTM
ncbi:Hypothetical_protein [Hexamita inflata]|uniref:Hypothetical_protein n=1 Tax=Hexamita inflata TaxID=28002 RepID=A0AA86UY22_9EUKA|nr:Hypothetical protein HINF_LOCUS64215 [Hexamita inflata]